jgi:hypothetical protein
MSKDPRVKKLFKEIDSCLANNFSDKRVTEWSIGTTYKCDTKWQKTIDDFITFKIYEPKECEECIPVEKRNTVEFKYTMHLPDDSRIQDSKHFRDESRITDFLESFKTAMSKKEKIMHLHNIYRNKK